MILSFTFGQKNAERKGFEPLEVVSLNGFQDRRNRPLCHLSESKSQVRNSPIWGAKVLPNFVICKSFGRFFEFCYELSFSQQDFQRQIESIRYSWDSFLTG